MKVRSEVGMLRRFSGTGLKTFALVIFVAALLWPRVSEAAIEIWTSDDGLQTVECEMRNPFWIK